MQSPIGTYIAQQGKIKIANPEFTNITGYREKELIAIPALGLVHPEEREQISVSLVMGNLDLGLRSESTGFAIIRNAKASRGNHAHLDFRSNP